MDQKKLINLYNKNLNSMFDDSESDEEIKDSVKDSHDKLNGLFYNENPELFFLIYQLIKEHYDLMQDISFNKKCIPYTTLNKINDIISSANIISDKRNSYFQFYNPKDGDFSIIFKYLKNVKYLSDYSFKFCEHLININLPSTIKRIGFGAFACCTNLDSISIPESVQSIGKQAFILCNSLKSITIPTIYKWYIQDIFFLVDLSKIKITYI